MKSLEIVLLWILLGSMTKMLGGAVMTGPEPKSVANFTSEVERDVCLPEERYKHTGLEADVESVLDIFIWPLAYFFSSARKAAARRRENISILREVQSLSNQYRRRQLRDLQEEKEEEDEKSPAKIVIRLFNDWNNNLLDTNELIGNLTLNIRPILQGPVVNFPRLNLIPEDYIMKLPPQRFVAEKNMTFSR
ncbi:uncharacterized protein [Drosophila bipectinata]|uniref:uncharacterized protein n=1 Tax=Drosophila bipectinata TaxID=42026 RepID=UPI001C895A3F|nr:uncharacterized protein LOC108124141 [Drosophila bipectinata]